MSDNLILEIAFLQVTLQMDLSPLDLLSLQIFIYSFLLGSLWQDRFIQIRVGNCMSGDFLSRALIHSTTAKHGFRRIFILYQLDCTGEFQKK